MHLRRLLTFPTLIAIICLMLAHRANASLPTVQVIYSFPNPLSVNEGVVIGANGSFYGVTSTGGPGTNNNGGIFVISSNGVLETNIWLNRTNGATPLAPLIPDKSGNFYGTASAGGGSNNGTVFKLTSTGQLVVLAYFNKTNGSTPMGPLLEGTNGWFYGTTFNGGSNSPGGIFRVSPAGVLSNVYSFSGSDGANPASGLIQGNNGKLYGTTEYGGANGLGTVFQLTYSNTLTTLYSFSSTTGAFPGGLVEDRGSNFYGPTISGGADFVGTIFKLNPSNNLQTLVTFGIANGSTPNSPLILGSNGVLYGTTVQGGDFGQGTIFLLNTNILTNRIGAFLVDVVSFAGTNGAWPRSGLSSGPDGNFYGTTSAGGAFSNGVIYELTGFSPYFIKPPTSQPYASNHTATFTVEAGGSAPLSYQWQFDGTNEMNNIPGATNASLVLTNEQLTNSGAYSVVVFNPYGLISASVALSVPPPIIAIRSPAAGVRTTNGAITGTASAFAGVGTVNYWITNVTFGTASSGMASLSEIGTGDSWSISNAPLLPGTNYVMVQSVDSLSNLSVIATNEFFYVVPSRFGLMTNAFGAGAIRGSASAAGGSPPTNGALLNIGEGYSLTATPSNHYVFSNWTSSTGFASNASTLNFIMESNLTITANFVTNLFIGAAGTYNGLFYGPLGVSEQTAGMLQNLTVGSNAAYTGKLLLGGVAYSLTGSFNQSGYASNEVNLKTAQGGSVAITLTLDWTGGQIAGNVFNINSNTWTSPLEAEKSAASSPSAEYTVLLNPGANPIGAVPPGDGYMLITNHNGSITISGGLADGSAFSQAVPLSVSNHVPVFSGSLYNNTGLLLGWLGFTNGTVTAEGPVAWIKPAVHSGLFTNGFTNYLLATGSVWTKPPANYLTNGTLTITNNGSVLDFAVSITNSTLVKGTNSATNSLTGIFYPTTGLLKIAFGNGAGKATTTGYAAILGDTTNGGGYFVTATNSGTITLAR